MSSPVTYAQWLGNISLSGANSKNPQLYGIYTAGPLAVFTSDGEYYISATTGDNPVPILQPAPSPFSVWSNEPNRVFMLYCNIGTPSATMNSADQVAVVIANVISGVQNILYIKSSGEVQLQSWPSGQTWPISGVQKNYSMQVFYGCSGSLPSNASIPWNTPILLGTNGQPGTNNQYVTGVLLGNNVGEFSPLPFQSGYQSGICDNTTPNVPTIPTNLGWVLVNAYPGWVAQKATPWLLIFCAGALWVGIAVAVALIGWWLYYQFRQGYKH